MLVSTQVGLAKQDSSCKECRQRLVFSEDSGEQVCRGCGVVNDGPNESPSYSSDYVAAMTNSAPRDQPTSNMMYDLNLSTVIDNQNVDANGRRIPASYELTQLRRWNTYTISRESRRSNEVKAMREIELTVGAAGLPRSVAIEASEIYRKGLRNGSIKRKSITSMAIASVLVACNLIGANFPAEEIEKLRTTGNGKRVRQYQKLLLRNMGMTVTTTDPSRDVSRIATKAGISGKVERRSYEILALVKGDSSLAGKRPTSLAAAALNVALTQMGQRKNQLRLAFAAGVTPITIRKRSAEISAILSTMETTAEPSLVAHEVPELIYA